MEPIRASWLAGHPIHRTVDEVPPKSSATFDTVTIPSPPLVMLAARVLRRLRRMGRRATALPSTSWRSERAKGGHARRRWPGPGRALPSALPSTVVAQEAARTARARLLHLHDLGLVVQVGLRRERADARARVRHGRGSRRRRRRSGRGAADPPWLSEGLSTRRASRSTTAKTVGAAIARVAADGFSSRVDALFRQSSRRSTGKIRTRCSTTPGKGRQPAGEAASRRARATAHRLRRPLLPHCRLFEDTLVVWRVRGALPRGQGATARGHFRNCYDAGFSPACSRPPSQASVLQNRASHNRTGVRRRARCGASAEIAAVAWPSFWTLTANKHALTDPIVSAMADRYGQTPACVFYRALVQMGITPPSGTSSEVHTRQEDAGGRPPAELRAGSRSMRRASRRCWVRTCSES